MPYRIECLGCKEYVYLDEIKKENTSYPCAVCNSPNWLSGTYAKFQEIDDETYSLNQNNSSDKSSAQTHDKINKDKSQSLSDKYNILKGMIDLAYLMMLVSTGFFIYAIVQFVDAPKIAREMLENAMITSTVSYVITMFSLFCLTKMIDFLFDLDKQDRILVSDKISSEKE